MAQKEDLKPELTVIPPVDASRLEGTEAYSKIHAKGGLLAYLPWTNSIHDQILNNYDANGSMSREYLLVVQLLLSLYVFPLQLTVALFRRSRKKIY